MGEQLGLADVARVMAIDASTAEVVQALHGAGLDPVLLKGPTLADWLYEAGEIRTYGDADLLVAPDAASSAEAALARLGFELQRYDWETWEVRQHHARTWYRRADRCLIDLHHTLPGIRGVPPREVWRVLRDHTVPWPLPPITVRALDEPARLLLVALHLFHHLPHGDVHAARPREDLEHAIARVGAGVWHAAAALAGELRAGPDLAHALHAAAGGPELAAALRLPPPSSGDDAVAGFERLVADRRPGARASALRRGLFPSREYLRWSTPLARRSRAGLLAAYAIRPVRLARGAAVMARSSWRRRRA